MPFPEIYRSQFHFLIFLVSSWYQRAKIPLRTSLRNKQEFRWERACETNKYLMNKKAYWIKNHCHFKWLYKTSCYKTKSNFSQFLYSNLLLYECFFSFLNTSVWKIWKVDKTSSSSFYYIWKWRKFENTDRNISWKLLIFCENYYYFDRLKPKVFFVDQPWWPA